MCFSGTTVCKVDISDVLSESTGDSVLLQAVCSGLGPLPLTIELQATNVAGERPICAKRKPSEYVRFDPVLCSSDITAAHASICACRITAAVQRE
jgi:hypothetical protein